MDIINQSVIKLICSILLFILCLLVKVDAKAAGITDFIANQAAAVASAINPAPAVAPPRFFAGNAPTPSIYSYMLYQSPPLYVESANNVNKRDETPPLRTCRPGYAACVTASMFNYSDFNPQECKLHLLRAEARITKKDTGYYNVNVWYQANQTHIGTERECYDRGGYFTYAIACVPVDNVDPAAITQTNCVIQ